MTLTVRSGRLAYILLYLYALFTVLFPVFIFNKLLFVLLFVWSMFCLVRGRVFTVAPLVIFTVFLLGYLLGFSANVDEKLAVQMLFSSLSLCLIYLISRKGFDLNDILKAVGLLFAFSICFFSLVLLVFPGSIIAERFLSFYIDCELGFYGVRDFGGLQVFMLHHRSSPFLVVPLCLFLSSYINSKGLLNLLAFSIVALAIFFTASRALILLGFLAAFFVYVLSVGRVCQVLIMFLGGTALLAFCYYLSLETSIFSLSEPSNDIKAGHFLSFLDDLDVMTFLVGDGLATYYFSIGRGDYVSQTEITFLDSVRYFGLPLTILVLICLMFPMLHKTFQLHGLVSVVFIFYLLMSFSNPILFNSFGFLVVLWYWADCIRYRKLKAGDADCVV